MNIEVVVIWRGWVTWLERPKDEVKQAPEGLPIGSRGSEGP